MTNIATKNRTTKKPTNKIEYIRLPLDSVTQQVIASIKAENPYFNDLDAVRYWLGKRLVSGQHLNQPITMKQFFDKYPREDAPIDEEQMYDI